MGDRVQVLVQPIGVYLYSHWAGESVQGVVSDALRRGKGRWTDPEYLARIIFCEMVKKDIDGETGYGIGTEEHGDLNAPTVTVDCDAQEVRIEGVEEARSFMGFARLNGSGA